MNNTKTKIKNFWGKNGDKIKIGLVCGLIGIFYGTTKGTRDTVNALCKLSNDEKIEPEKAGEDDDITSF